MGRITHMHVAIAIVAMVTVNVGTETYTTDFNVQMYKSDIIQC